MKKLHRSRRTKVLGGVAAGFAEYFGIDVTVMRLLFALVAVTMPNAILAYILAWIIIPEEPLEGPAAPRETPLPKAGDTHLDDRKETASVPPTAEELLSGKTVSAPVSQAPTYQAPAHPAQANSAPVGHDRNRQLFGYILVFVGLIVLSRKFIPSFIWRLPSHLMGQFWPVLIILVGAALIFGAIRGR